jgi:hypothetical protein
MVQTEANLGRWSSVLSVLAGLIGEARMRHGCRAPGAGGPSTLSVPVVVRAQPVDDLLIDLRVGPLHMFDPGWVAALAKYIYITF